MSKVSPLVDGLIEAMQCLPGVGPKSAQRMVLHLLERNRDGGIMLADIMAKAIEGVGKCKKCRTNTRRKNINQTTWFAYCKTNYLCD